jgi:hypothetical protein
VIRSLFAKISKKPNYLKIRSFTYYIPAPPGRKTGYQEKEFDHIIAYLIGKDFDIINFKIEESKRNDEGRGLVVFNSSGYLEIAVYKSNCSTVGSASTLMGLKTMDTVTVNFSKT